ncbi:MAG: terminase gpA endonuclease subunit [Phycisphaerae bacterium]
MATGKAKIDPTTLTQSELLQLVNHTPLGPVLTRSRLRRQMDAGALRFGDGTHIHLVRYVRWLVVELDKPRPAKMDYGEAKRRQAERNRAATKASQDIHPVPEVEDVERRRATSDSFRLFCETYFPAAFYRTWSADHLRVIDKIERAVKEGGLFAFAMPRGSGKTTLARLSALWAVLVGYRPFVCLIGGSDDRAKDLLLPIKKYILENPFLLADFPEAVHPLRRLENSSKRQLQQHIAGRLTHVHWGQDKLVFPTVEAEHLPTALREQGLETSPSSGSIITITSLDSNMRGQQHTRTDGSVLRPSLVLLDDPQTRQSARSPTQTKYRLQLLNGDVLGLAGPGEQIAGVLTCTKIYEGDLADQVLDPEKCPEWQAECTKLIYSLPTNQKLWDEYAAIRADSLRRGHGGKDATEFYRAHREEMDTGAEAAWAERFDSKRELSAVQHAMNLKLQVGDEAFASEYQNEPVAEQLSDDRLTVEQVCEKVNGRPRGEVPLAATKLTMFVDVHDRLLFYCVAAWAEDFTGYVVDYGTFPQQRRDFFTLANAPRTLRRAFPGAGADGAIHAGLEKLVAAQLARKWKRGDGLMKIDRLLVDMGYKPGIVADVKHKVGGAVMWLAKGVGIRAGRKPLSSYSRHPGETHGHFWYVPNVKKTAEFPHVMVDVNYWKTFVHAGLATAAGDRGCISLFGSTSLTAGGDDGQTHELFAEHVAHSETWVETEGHGRVVHEWSLRPTRPDNHWFDCLVGCAVAASMCGIRTPGEESRQTRRRKRYRKQDLIRSRAI